MYGCVKMALVAPQSFGVITGNIKRFQLFKNLIFALAKNSRKPTCWWHDQANTKKARLTGLLKHVLSKFIAGHAA